MNGLWQNWAEFHQSVKGKKVVFFGLADHWFSKILFREKLDLAFLVDNSTAHIGQKHFVDDKFGQIEVKSPEVLKEKRDDLYVVITSNSYASIIPQLVSYGLKPGENFCCAPPLNELKIIADIDHCQTKLLVCSPDHKIYSELNKNSQIGGGLYLYDIAKNRAEKLLSGSVQHIIPAGNNYYLLDQIKGGFLLDKNFQKIFSFGFEEDAKSHGLALEPAAKRVFIAKPGLDKVSIYNTDNLKLEKDIFISDKMLRFKQQQHHINDIFVKDNYLYVSMFSHSGNWRYGVYDGGILEIDLSAPEKNRRVLVSKAWMPHNVCFLGGDFCYLDSMRGDFYKGTENVVGHFEGNFIRGIAFDGQFYFIGTSEHRHFEALKDKVKFINMRAGFYLFDEQTKAGRFFPLAQTRLVRNLVIYKG